MGILSHDKFKPGQKHIPQNKINDLLRSAQNAKRSSGIRVNGRDVNESMREEGADIDIDGYPMLYRVVTTSAGAEQSSSSSGSGADIEVSVKRVDASTGTTYGPALRVKVIE